MNQEKHWNFIAPSYEEEIFDAFKSDRKKILPFYFRKHANMKHRAIDFGCGVGKAFPFLAPSFKEVLAVDISQECLMMAKKLPYSNIEFVHADLSKPDLHFEQADFAFCCNVIMLPEVAKNYTMFRTIQQSLKSRGNAVIILPSLESIFFASWQLIRLYKLEGIDVKDIDESEFHYFKGTKRDIIQGIMYINGVPTKHYSEPEIQIIFQEVGLKVTAIEKVEYNWNTEFETVPDWLTDPYPWDWLIECKKA
jgi:SAM-dependent methyltransferase